MGKLTKEEKESGIITIITFVVVMVLLFVLKFDVEKKKEDKEIIVEVLDEGGGGGGGATINFGDSDHGLGAKYQSDAVSKVTPSQSAPAEEVVGSDDDKAEAVANTQPVKNRDPKVNNPKPVTDNKPKTPAPPRNSALDAILGGSNSGGSGNTTAGGNQGSHSGISSGSYGDGGTGNGRGGGNGSGDGTGTGPGTGSGSGGGNGSGIGNGNGSYRLKGRNLIDKKEPRYTCNEEGTVVVEISVDKSGKVISVNPGVKGTTNAARCLLDQAKIAAMNTKFDASNSAPDKQVGTIIYRFKLTE